MERSTTGIVVSYTPTAPGTHEVILPHLDYLRVARKVTVDLNVSRSRNVSGHCRGSPGKSGTQRQHRRNYAVRAHWAFPYQYGFLDRPRPHHEAGIGCCNPI